jgi:hypothetical protein
LAQVAADALVAGQGLRLVPLRDTAATRWRGKVSQTADGRVRRVRVGNRLIYGDFQSIPINSNHIWKKYEGPVVNIASRTNLLLPAKLQKPTRRVGARRAGTVKGLAAGLGEFGLADGRGKDSRFEWKRGRWLQSLRGGWSRPARDTAAAHWGGQTESNRVMVNQGCLKHKKLRTRMRERKINVRGSESRGGKFICKDNP